MKYLALLGLLASGVASANTTASFTAVHGAICTNYCTAYTTNNPLVTVDYADVTLASTVAPTPYKVTLHVNGVYYAGTAVAPAWVSGVAMYASDGTYINVKNLTWTTSTHCVGSGRGQHCTTSRFAQGGYIAFPYTL